MKKPGYLPVVKPAVLLLLLPVAVLLTAFKVSAKDQDIQLAFRDMPLKARIDRFYVAQVTDERSDKKHIGQLIPYNTAALKQVPAPVPAQLEGGGITAIDAFLKHNLPSQKGLRPIIVKVTRLTVNETPDNTRVDGKLDMAISFDLKTGEDMSVRLVTYKGSANYTRTINQPGAAEPVLRSAIENALTFFNSWLDSHADTNPLLAKSVKLIFSDYKDETEGDTIYYDKDRPLKWDDFRDHPHGSTRYAAEVTPGLGFDEKTSIKNGVIYVQMAMKPFLPKSAAWVRPGYTDEITLNHEQRHFDITRIISDRFKKKMLKEQLPVLNFDGTINFEYFDTLRELNKMQKQYDDETNHGLNASAQQRWNELIDKELNKAQS